jgi:hypothetical protein
MYLLKKQAASMGYNPGRKLSKVPTITAIELPPRSRQAIERTMKESEEHAFGSYNLVQSLENRAKIRKLQRERSRMIPASQLHKYPFMEQVYQQVVSKHPNLKGRLYDAALLVQDSTKSTTFGFHTNKHGPIEDTVVVLLNRGPGRQNAGGVYVLGDKEIRRYRRKGDAIRFSGGKDPHITVPHRGGPVVKGSFFFTPQQ